MVKPSLAFQFVALGGTCLPGGPPKYAALCVCRLMHVPCALIQPHVGVMSTA